MRPISAVMANEMKKLNNPSATYMVGSSATPKRAKKSASMALPPIAPPAEVNSINPTRSVAMRCSPGRILNVSRMRLVNGLSNGLSHGLTDRNRWLATDSITDSPPDEGRRMGMDDCQRIYE